MRGIAMAIPHAGRVEGKMMKGAVMFMALLAVSCSGVAGPARRAGFTLKKEGPVLNSVLDKNTRTIAIEKGGLSGVALKYVYDGDFDPIDLQVSRIEGRLNLIEGTPGDFGVRINSAKKTFGHPLFITVPVRGLDTTNTAVGYCINDDGTLSPIDMIEVNRKNGSATFSLYVPLLIVWALVPLAP
jgi:hypothetical protein